MKKLNAFLVVGLIAFFASISSVQAQADYQKGDFLFNAGLGFGYYYAGGIPFMVNGEYAFTDKLTIGPYLGYTSYNYGYFGYDFKYRFIDFGARGSYHFSELFGITNEKLDIYGGAFLGFTVSSYSGDSFSGYDDAYGSRVTGGLHAGARYYFTEKFGAYGELGYGLAPLALGITLKL
jgi:hypothetical protein